MSWKLYFILIFSHPYTAALFLTWCSLIIFLLGFWLVPVPKTYNEKRIEELEKREKT